ncbi:MAG: hypothetical protein V4479_09455, partial [Actinomycetota bacterium]
MSSHQDGPCAVDSRCHAQCPDPPVVAGDGAGAGGAGTAGAAGAAGAAGTAAGTCLVAGVAGAGGAVVVVCAAGSGPDEGPADGVDGVAAGLPVIGDVADGDSWAFAAIWRPATIPTKAITEPAPTTVRAPAAGRCCDGETAVTHDAALPFCRLGDRTIHLCIDMQELFAQQTAWHV